MHRWCAEGVLVRFYGEGSLMWVAEGSLCEGPLEDSHIAQLQAWGRLNRKCVGLLNASVYHLCNCNTLGTFLLVKS